VGPGSGIQFNEGLPQASIREVKEETSLIVQPGSMLFIEDLQAQHYRMIKFWFFCTMVGGQLVQTQEAKEEDIIEVNWFSKDDLKNEIVYPTIIRILIGKYFLKITGKQNILDWKRSIFKSDVATKLKFYLLAYGALHTKLHGSEVWQHLIDTFCNQSNELDFTLQQIKTVADSVGVHLKL